jgi:hypothetical protein
MSCVAILQTPSCLPAISRAKGEIERSAGFANHQRCRIERTARTADLPLAGDVRQDRGVTERYLQSYTLTNPSLALSKLRV